MTQEQRDTPQFYYRTSDAWDAMYEDCLKVRQSIEFEQYMLLDDAAGRRFLDLFIEKARAGVKVRLLLDQFGSLGLTSAPIVKEMIAAGIDISFYNPMKWGNLFFPKTWYPRNHTKTLLLDGEIGYIGSVCICAEMKDWHDCHVRFTGELAHEIAQVFRNGPRSQTPERSMQDYRYEISRPRQRHNPVYEELLVEIFRAQHEIILATPYFLAPRRLRRALYAAAARGVKVKIMMSEKTDAKIADFVTRTYFKKLLRKRIRLYLYNDGMMHAKYAAIDRNWATIGSTNMDYLSLIHNREANLLIRDGATVGVIQDHFHDDLRRCQEVTLDYCRHIPLYQRLAGWLGRPLKHML